MDRPGFHPEAEGPAKSDWADEIADFIIGDLKRGSHKEMVAIALRKAKADGMREAAMAAKSMWYESDDEFCHGFHSAIIHLEEIVMARAAEIEKGNA